MTKILAFYANSVLPKGLIVLFEEVSSRNNAVTFKELLGANIRDNNGILSTPQQFKETEAIAFREFPVLGVNQGRRLERVELGATK
ncbi:hypothetical protein ElyMa_001513000 [Elysia marginata]|uniref:Uncharacterized protein n=1 Tax=Elysia marginata TaxID=1093978 RepID=A0AAV4J8G4_9GAST|nr:hypothetical protein ElyMa_001513000 [Elysia marginata]